MSRFEGILLMDKIDQIDSARTTKRRLICLTIIYYYTPMDYSLKYQIENPKQ